MKKLGIVLVTLVVLLTAFYGWLLYSEYHPVEQ